MYKSRIAFVLNDFPNLSETFILNQITYLIDQGYDLTIYSRSCGNEERLHSQVLKYNLLEKVVYVPTVPRSFFARIKSIVKVVKKRRDRKLFCNLLKCFNFFKLGRPGATLYVAYNFVFMDGLANSDVIHAHFGSSGVLISFFKKVGLLKDNPLICSFHGYDIAPTDDIYNGEIYRDLFKYAAYCTVNSSYSRGLLEKIPSERPRNIIMLPVGLDLAKFQSSVKNNSSLVEILFCGRLISLKGPDLAIRIINELVKSGVDNVRLTLVGEGPLYGTLTSMIENYALSEHVVLVGAKTQEELVTHYRCSDIFLFPGIHDPKTGRCETQGLVVQEAQAMRLPVVVSDVGGIQYGMINGTSGFVVKEGDIKGFVDALKTLILDSHLRNTMGNAGRDFVSRYFDSKSLGQKLEEIYDDALNKNENGFSALFSNTNQSWL